MRMRCSHGSPVFTFSSLTRLLTSGNPRPRNTSFSRCWPPCIPKQNTPTHLGEGVSLRAGVAQSALTYQKQQINIIIFMIRLWNISCAMRVYFSQERYKAFFFIFFLKVSGEGVWNVGALCVGGHSCVTQQSPLLIKTGSEISCLPGSSSYPLIRRIPPDGSNIQHHESSGCCRLRRSSAEQTRVSNSYRTCVFTPSHFPFHLDSVNWQMNGNQEES